MMKLPGLQIGGVQALQTAQADVTKEKAYVSMGESVASLGATYQDITLDKWKQQGEEADLQLAKDISDFEAEHFSKQFYSAEDLPADSSVPKFETKIGEDGAAYDSPRLQIPAYEVWPELYKNRMESYIGANASKIENTRLSDKWSTEMTTKAAIKFNEFSTKVKKEQFDQHRIVQDQNMLDLLTTGNYEAAKQVAGKLNGTDEERSTALRVVNVQEETDNIEEIMIDGAETGDVKELKDQLALMQDEDAYVKSGGNLDDTDRHGVIHKLITHIAGIEKTTASYDKLYVKQLKRDSKQLTNQLRSGENVNLRHMGNIQSQHAILAQKNPEIAYNERLDLEEATQDNVFLRDLILGNSPLEARRAIQIARQGELSPRMDSMLRRVEAQYDKFQAALKKDAVQAYKDYTIGTITDIDYTSDESIRATYGDRFADFQVLRETYNSETHLLTEAERGDLGYLLSTQNPEQRIQTISAISSTLGPSAATFWDGLVDDRQSGPYAVAGQLMNSNPAYHQVGRNILEGSQLILDTPEFLGGIRQEYGHKMIEAVNLWSPTSTQQEAYTDAIWSLYAFKSREKNDAANWNSDRFRQSVEEVTGGVYDFNGRKILAPVAGLPEDTFKTWATNLTPDAFDGSATNANKEQLAAGLANGDYSLVPLGYPRYTYAIQSNARGGSSSRKNFINYGGGNTTVTFDTELYEDQTRRGQAAKQIVQQELQRIRAERLQRMYNVPYKD